MAKKLTKNQFIERARKVHGNKFSYEKTEYKGRAEKVTITCKIHGDFIKKAGNHLNGQGCPVCGNLRSGSTNRDSLESFIKKAKKIHKDKYDYSLTDYKGTNTKVKIICPDHGVFEQTPNSHLQNHGCPECAIYKSKKTKIDWEKIKIKLEKKHNNKYKYIFSKYKGRYTPITIICPEHGKFSQSLRNHLNGQGCPECTLIETGLKRRKDTEYFIKKSKEYHEDKYDYTKTVYTKRNQKVTITCQKHGDFEQLAGNHMIGVGCPKCACVGPSTKEQELYEFINNLIESQQSNRTILESKELDIYIPSKKIAIEFNGLYYHSNKFKDKNYHLNKTKECKKKGIRLIHIFEDEWLNKKEIVKSRLLNILGKTSNKLYARKCEIKEVPTKEAMKFLEDNHIQGKVGAKVKLGLYYKNELVSLMTFGKLRKSLGNNHKEGHYELLRFCNKLNYSVVGGAGKLLKHFKNYYSWKEIISYADLRWSEGNLYEKLNFIKNDISQCNYFYITQSSPEVREPRFKYRKSELLKWNWGTKDQTEKEIMKERGFLRIYDCGTIKFKMTK